MRGRAAGASRRRPGPVAACVRPRTAFQERLTGRQEVDARERNREGKTSGNGETGSVWHRLRARVTGFSTPSEGQTQQMHCVCEYTHTHTQTHPYTHRHTQMHARKLTHTHTDTQKHTHTHSPTHTHIVQRSATPHIGRASPQLQAFNPHII